MIITRTPLRISFVGGGSDFPDFYNKYPGEVISTTINKYVYVTINTSSLLKGITVRYSRIEQVNKIDDLKNDRIREVMKYFNIQNPIEISVMSDLPVGLGLGGSSAFTVALIKGLSIYKGETLSKWQIADLACKIEIDILNEPIGKQDQYICATGGLNWIIFSKNQILPIGIKQKSRFKNYLCLFYTGKTREAKTVLTEQKNNIPQKIKILNSMVDSVDCFRKNLIKKDFRTLGKIIHDNWMMKKNLASTITNPKIDKLYEKGIKAGAWGGKLLGAGGGGCLLFIAPPYKKETLKNALGLKEIPFEFTDEGTEVIYE